MDNHAGGWGPQIPRALDLQNGRKPFSTNYPKAKRLNHPRQTPSIFSQNIKSGGLKKKVSIDAPKDETSGFDKNNQVT